MFVAIVLALVISIINGYVFWLFSVSLLFLLSLFYINSKLTLNPLTVAVFLFTTLLILNMILVRPANDPDAAYLIGFFATAFLLFSFATVKFIRQTLYSLCVLFLMLGFWGLLQYLTGSGYLINVGHRANAIFYTPNTYAAALNIILLPLIVLYVYHKERTRLLPLILILFAALLVSQSRGGWIAFFSSLLFIFILTRFLKTTVDWTRVKKLILGLILVFSAYGFIELAELNRDKINIGLGLKNEVSYLIRSKSVVSTMNHRFMLYDIAWQQIKQRPLLGWGFHTYQYFQVREQSAPHIGNKTRFVHNDYLQLWMEVGVFGLILFVFIPIIVITITFKVWSRLSVRDRTSMLALTAGMVGFYVQALVDFLFYTPFLLMMYGCYLGYLNQLFNKYPQGLLHVNLSLPHIIVRPVVIKILVGIVVVCYLSQPAIAQLVFDQANRDKNRLDIESALVWYELARRFAPYQASYYQVEADIWYHAAKSSGDTESARRADYLFKKGVSANPFKVENLFWRAILHRDLPELLSDPVSYQTVSSWLQTVLYWLPNDHMVQAEYVRTLSLMSKYDEAKELLNIYLQQSPESFYLKRVQLEIDHNDD